MHFSRQHFRYLAESKKNTAYRGPQARAVERPLTDAHNTRQRRANRRRACILRAWLAAHLVPKASSWVRIGTPFASCLHNNLIKHAHAGDSKIMSSAALSAERPPAQGLRIQCVPCCGCEQCGAARTQKGGCFVRAQWCSLVRCFVYSGSAQGASTNGDCACVAGFVGCLLRLRVA